jgi:ribulose-phosphate 3-epimerase
MAATRRKSDVAEPKFAPSILSADFARLGEAVLAVERAGADWIHVDVMDGHFVPNLTFGPKMVADLRKATRLPLDVHLMIERPEDWVDRYADAGATYLTIHVEASSAVSGTLEAIRARGVRAGLTLNPETPVDAVIPYLDAIDLALVMSVHPGFGGQKFIETALDKVKAIRIALDSANNPAELEVDGGVKPDNAGRVAAAGASVLVAGSAIFEDPDGPVAALGKFKRAIRGVGEKRFGATP